MWSSSQFCIYTCSVVHSICLSSTLSCIFPVTWSAISSSVRFIRAFTEPSWFLYQILLVARHMLYWHAQDNLASQILASFPGSHAGPRTRAWEWGYTNHEITTCMWYQENKSPCIYLQQLTLTGTVFKVFNLVQIYAGTIPKQYNM